jgi:hypothetical protein
VHLNSLSSAWHTAVELLGEGWNKPKIDDKIWSYGCSTELRAMPLLGYELY